MITCCVVVRRPETTGFEPLLSGSTCATDSDGDTDIDLLSGTVTVRPRLGDPARRRTPGVTNMCAAADTRLGPGRPHARMEACPPWCNGSTSDFGSDGPGSSPGG